MAASVLSVAKAVSMLANQKVPGHRAADLKPGADTVKLLTADSLHKVQDKQHFPRPPLAWLRG